MEGRTETGRRVRVLRVIARMNMGGPAHHVAILSGGLDPERYDTTLVSGRVAPGEESMAAVAEEHGAKLHYVDGLGPELRPDRDPRALAGLVRIVREIRPDVVATHTAKAGQLGRLAALAVRPRPRVVHTYHGHVLEGYFGPTRTAVYRSLERAMGRVSDLLLGVSQATVDDLVRLRIAPAQKFRVLPLGLPLEPFLGVRRDGARPFRAEIGAAEDEVVVTWVGRLVPIKRVEVLLDAVAQARGRGARLRLVLVGDGPLRAELERRVAVQGLEGAVIFAGYRRDLAHVAQGADIAALSSANEGTPVSLIEAAAAGLPLVSTRVGGVADVVVPGAGTLVEEGDAARLAAALETLAADPQLRGRLGAAAREHVRTRYSVDRLLTDVDALYTELLLTGRQVA